MADQYKIDQLIGWLEALAKTKPDGWSMTEKLDKFHNGEYYLFKTDSIWAWVGVGKNPHNGITLVYYRREKAGPFASTRDESYGYIRIPERLKDRVNKLFENCREAYLERSIQGQVNLASELLLPYLDPQMIVKTRLKENESE